MARQAVVMVADSGKHFYREFDGASRDAASHAAFQLVAHPRTLATGAGTLTPLDAGKSLFTAVFGVVRAKSERDGTIWVHTG